jgi:ribosomal-protein-alanine N-acetyltransferase
MTGDEKGEDIEIRQAAAFDAALLAALHAACFGKGDQSSQLRAWDEAAMAQFIAGPTTLCLLATVAVEEPRPVGFLIARAAGDEAELITIGVVRGSRNRGAGRTLLQHASDTLKTSGVQTLFFEVDETNAPAIALYRALGAEAVGRRPGYYENGGDAAVLRLDL